jgi:hypothetical protein
VVIAVTACGGDGDGPTTPPPTPSVTVYALATVNGQPLPYASPVLTSTRTLADTIRLGSDARYTRTLVTDEARGGGRRDTTRTPLSGPYATTSAGLLLGTGPGVLTTRPDGALELRATYGTGSLTDVYVYPRVAP